MAIFNNPLFPMAQLLFLFLGNFSVETPPSSISRLRSVRLDTWLSDDQIDCTMLQRGGLEALSHGGIPAFKMGKSS